uniref:Uncharacterized protein n=1 Tax=Manihot esculenta TaxID=3983 RepID=A0A2C9U3B2_MANES
MKCLECLRIKIYPYSSSKFIYFLFLIQTPVLSLFPSKQIFFFCNSFLNPNNHHHLFLS